MWYRLEIFCFIRITIHEGGNLKHSVKPLLRQFYANFFINWVSSEIRFLPTKKWSEQLRWTLKNHKFLRKTHICTCTYLACAWNLFFVFLIFTFLEKMRVLAKVSKMWNKPVWYAKNHFSRIIFFAVVLKTEMQLKQT